MSDESPPAGQARFSAAPHVGGRSWHDMGGLLDSLPGPKIDPESHDYALWEKRVDALLVLMTSKGLFTVDGLRRALEDMGPQSFETMTYYERWIASVTQNLLEAGVFSVEELRAKTDEIAARGPTYGDATAPKPETAE